MAVPPGVAWKIKRAAGQTQTIGSEIDAFLRKQPPPYELEKLDDPDAGERRYIFKAHEAPPAVQWAGMIGEVLHNLRSALDHLAFALCMAHRPDQSPPELTEFPVFYARD